MSPTRSRRGRPTLLLRLVIWLTSLTAFVGIVAWWGKDPMGGAAVVVLLTFWLVALEFELLPMLLERWAARRARRSPRRVDSIWFVDLDDEGERAREKEAVPWL